MNKERIINAILLEYSLLSPNGGVSGVDANLLLKAIENLGYQDYFSYDKLDESSDVINKMVPHLPEAKAKPTIKDKIKDKLKKLKTVTPPKSSKSSKPEPKIVKNPTKMGTKPSKISKPEPEDEPVKPSVSEPEMEKDPEVKPKVGGKYLTKDQIKIIRLILGADKESKGIKVYVGRNEDSTDREDTDGSLLSLVDISGVTLPNVFDVGKIAAAKPMTYQEMAFQLENSEKNFRFTQSPTVVKLYNGEGKAIAMINLPIGLKVYDDGKITSNFKKILLWTKLFQDFPKKIDEGEAPDQDIKTKLSADNLQKYFDTNNPEKISFSLFFKNMGKFFNSKAKADSAKYIKGTQKADIALLDKGVETFWISYKAADYYAAFGSSELGKVGIRHYGLIASLSQRLQNNPLWTDIEKRLLAGLRKNMTGIKLENVVFDENKKPISINGKRLEELSLTEQQVIIIRNSTSIYNMFHPPGGGAPKQNKFLYVPNGPFSAYLTFLNTTGQNSKELKEIAGKAIYGLDFTMSGDTTKFGRENCSVVMFSKTELTIEKHVDDTPKPALLIATDGKGNVYPNPFLPLPESEGDPIMRYLPTFEISAGGSGRTDKHNFYQGNEDHLFLVTRVSITARDKIPSGSIDLAK